RHELLWFRVGQRTQKNRVEHAEYRTTRTDTQCEREHCRDREAGTCAQGTQREANIADDGAHDHSERMRVAGAIRRARRAGSQHAASATLASSVAVSPNVTGSVVPTSNRKLASARAAMSPPTAPATIPAATGSIPWRTTRPSTDPGLAPSAMRMPISRVRSAVVTAITP